MPKKEESISTHSSRSPAKNLRFPTLKMRLFIQESVWEMDFYLSLAFLSTLPKGEDGELPKDFKS